MQPPVMKVQDLYNGMTAIRTKKLVIGLLPVVCPINIFIISYITLDADKSNICVSGDTKYFPFLRFVSSY